MKKKPEAEIGTLSKQFNSVDYESDNHHDTKWTSYYFNTKEDAEGFKKAITPIVKKKSNYQGSDFNIDEPEVEPYREDDDDLGAEPVGGEKEDQTYWVERRFNEANGKTIADGWKLYVDVLKEDNQIDIILKKGKKKVFIYYAKEDGKYTLGMEDDAEEPIVDKFPDVLTGEKDTNDLIKGLGI